MKWITREHVKVDRVACPWLVKKFVDKDAEFIFVPADKVMAEAKRLDATPYDVKDVELGHHGKECSFEAILKKYKLTSDPALVLLGRIVNGADTDNTLYRQAEGPGLVAIAEGFRHLGYKDDHELNAAEWIVYDALYAYAQEMVRRGKPAGQFASRAGCESRELPRHEPRYRNDQRHASKENQHQHRFAECFIVDCSIELEADPYAGDHERRPIPYRFSLLRNLNESIALGWSNYLQRARTFTVKVLLEVVSCSK